MSLQNTSGRQLLVDTDLQGTRKPVRSARKHRHLAALTARAQALKLEALDVGATNRNEAGETMYNQCFYLSLARASRQGTTLSL